MENSRVWRFEPENTTEKTVRDQWSCIWDPKTVAFSAVLLLNAGASGKENESVGGVSCNQWMGTIRKQWD